MWFELNGVDDVLAKLNPTAYKKALNRTINDIGDKTKTQLVKGVRKIYNIRAAKLKRHINIKRSRYSDMQYIILIQSKRRNVMNFGAKKIQSKRITKKGKRDKRGNISVKIRNDRGRAILRGAFYAENGAVLHRVCKTQKVEGLRTISIPQMFNNKIVKESEQIAKKEFKKKLQDNFDFYIGKV